MFLFQGVTSDDNNAQYSTGIQRTQANNAMHSDSDDDIEEVPAPKRPRLSSARKDDDSEKRVKLATHPVHNICVL